MRELNETLTEIAVHLAEIKKDLEYHILRTDQNEEYIHKVNNRLIQVESETQKQLVELTITMKSYQKSMKILFIVLSVLTLGVELYKSLS